MADAATLEGERGHEPAQGDGRADETGGHQGGCPRLLTRSVSLQHGENRGHHDGKDDQ